MEKPSQISTIGIMMLVSGILNVLAGLLLTGTVVIGTFGFGLLCAPLTILPSVLGVFEIVIGSKLMSSTGHVRGQTVQLMTILEIVSVLWGNAISLVLGILGLVFYNSEEVRAYYNRVESAQ